MANKTRNSYTDAYGRVYQQSATNPAVYVLVSSVFTSSTSGTVPASGGGTTNFLRADGTWAVPPGSGGGGGNDILAWLNF